MPLCGHMEGKGGKLIKPAGKQGAEKCAFWYIIRLISHYSS